MESEKGKDNGEKKKGKGLFSRLRRTLSIKKPKKTVVEDEGNGCQSELVVSGQLDKTANASVMPQSAQISQHAEFSCNPVQVTGLLCTNDKLNQTKGYSKISKNLAVTVTKDSESSPKEEPKEQTSQSASSSSDKSEATITPSAETRQLSSPISQDGKTSPKVEPKEQTSQSASSSSDKSETTITPSAETRQLSSPTSQDGKTSPKEEPKEQTSQSASRSSDKSETTTPSSSEARQLSTRTSQDSSLTTESQSLDLSVDSSCIPPESIRSEHSEGTSRNKDSFGVASVVANSEETRTCTEPKPDKLEHIDTHVQYIKAKKVQTGDRSVMNVHDYRGVSKIPVVERRQTSTDEKKKSRTLVQHIEAEELQTGPDSVMSLTMHTNNKEPTCTEVDDDTHASNRCDEFLKKTDKNVLTAAELKAMNEVIKSVGRIHFTGTSGDSYGTAFLVGSSHYIFTAWHIVRDIISVNEIGAAHGHNLKKLTKPDVYMDFGDNKCLLKPTVIYHNEELDVALLQLQENTEDGNKIWFPSSLREFNKFENITEITILGYGHPDSAKGAVADNKCEVINDRSMKSQQAIKWFNSEGKNTVKQLLHQSNELCMLQDLQSPYDLINNPKYIVCNSFVTKGGSGSPMVTMSGKVVGLYTRGIPGFYWKIKEDLRSEIPVKFVFGCGVRFDAIYKSMQEFQQHEPESLTAEIMKDIFHSP